MKKILFALLLTAISSAKGASQFEFSNKQGPYDVGLRIIRQYDFTRAYRGEIDLSSGQVNKGERARPVQTLVWYPAQAGGTKLRYDTYVRSAVTEENDALNAEEAGQAAQDWIAKRWDGLSAALIAREMARPMWAVADAAPAGGHFPVVIYAPSFSASAHENADLCEYLASQGYVVLSSPSMGAHGRGMSHEQEDTEAQVGDIEFLIGFSRTLPQADVGHIAVIGYSWGGLSNILAAAKDNRISALVSMDGSVRYFPALVNAVKYAPPSSITVPLLFVAARPSSIEDMIAYKQDLSGSFLNQLKYSDWRKLTIYPMVHANFSAEYQRFALDDGWGFGEYNRTETSLAYSWMAQYIHRFLDAYLKKDAAALRFLERKPEANGVPPHWLAAEHHPASGPAPTLQTLAAELGKQGFDHALEAYRTLQKNDETFALSEESLRHWGYQLLWANHNREAIAVFKLVTVLFPQSGNAFDCLGEAYQQNHDDKLAIDNYVRSFALDPKNDNATQHLKVLRARLSIETPRPL
jgi:dienelactone hydrolase